MIHQGAVVLQIHLQLSYGVNTYAVSREISKVGRKVGQEVGAVNWIIGVWKCFLQHMVHLEIQSPLNIFATQHLVCMALRPLLLSELWLYAAARSKNNTVILQKIISFLPGSLTEPIVSIFNQVLIKFRSKNVIKLHQPLQNINMHYEICMTKRTIHLSNYLIKKGKASPTHKGTSQNWQGTTSPWLLDKEVVLVALLFKIVTTIGKFIRQLCQCDVIIIWVGPWCLLVGYLTKLIFRALFL